MSVSLSDMMFDHVIEVHEDGSITGGPDGVYAPELYDGELSDTAYGRSLSGWELQSGYSGQYGYSGPVMHPSEYIGGGLERDIRSTPGLWVALVNYVTTDGDDEDDIDGWAVAYREAE
jgi:hypothetical protein